MYPVQKLPLILRYASSLNPLTYGIDGLKHVLLSEGINLDFPFYIDIGVLAFSSMVFLFLSTLVFEKIR